MNVLRSNVQNKSMRIFDPEKYNIEQSKILTDLKEELNDTLQEIAGETDAAGSWDKSKL